VDITNESSELADIFKGSSPFNDGGELEVIDRHPKGAKYHSCWMLHRNLLLG
jgi:hypothetical protein